MRKFFAIFFGLIAMAGFANAGTLLEGVQYVAYRPAHPTGTPNKVDVTEFFWYGCGHCYSLDPSLQKWTRQLPKDVAFQRVPAVFAGRDGTPGPWASGARIFYTLEAMGLLEKLHGAVFDAVQKERVRLLTDDSTLYAWMASKGIDANRFADVYKSFTVQTKVRRAMQITESYGFDGVPAIIVDGRYRAINEPSNDATLAVVDQLIVMARKDRAAGK